MPLQPGDTIDRYVIEARLGAGGMGEVYRARDTRLQRKVALKILHEEMDAPATVTGSRPSTGGAARMLREARAAAALDHANVVAVFDVGQIDTPGALQGTTYLAMELIKGSSMRAYVGDDRVGIPERVRWLIDVARALGAAHQVGLVHRDIKPENVMIRDDGQVKVLDFGIARRAHGAFDPSASTAEVTLQPAPGAGSVSAGTPLYMSPEQLRAEPLDGRADQFGWGVLAYELLTGEPPWSKDVGMMALVSQVLSRVPRAVDEDAPDVPKNVAAAVARALQKDRAARFPSMEALIEALGVRADARSTAPPLVGKTDPLAPTQRAASSVDSAKAQRHVELDTAPASSNPTPPRVAPPAPPARRAPRAAIAAGAFVLLGGAIAAALVARTKAPRASNATSAATTPSAAAPECTSNKACVDAHGGKPWICRADTHACASLASEDCSVLAEPGDVERDSTIWIGMMLPLTGELAYGFKPTYQAADLARQDFAGTLGVTGNARHIAVVSCDGDRNAMRAARHLVDDLRVPAVLLGIVGTESIVELASKVFGPADVLAMLPHSSSASVTGLPQGPSGRLVWRSTFGVQPLIDTAAALIEDVVEPQRKQRDHEERTRVAYVHPKSVMVRVLSDRLLSVLRINGKSVIENGDDFREIALEEGDEAHARARAELSSFRPTIVIGVSPDDLSVRDFQALEDQWRTGSLHPTYVFPYSLVPEMSDFIAASPERRRRFFGMDTVSATIANADFVNHYNETFPEKVTRNTAPNNIYDGFYALAYAIEALGDEPVTGPAMARAFRRLAGPGKTFTVGPHAIFDAYAELRSGASIDLEGAAGHLDLDPTTGESTFDIAILCVAPSARGVAARVIESGLVYSQRDRRFTGTLACP